jgi:hypothetical protein
MMVDVIKELKLKCDAIECEDRETCLIYKFLQCEPLTISIGSDTKQDRFTVSFYDNGNPYYHMDIGVCPNWTGIRRNV